MIYVGTIKQTFVRTLTVEIEADSAEEARERLKTSTGPDEFKPGELTHIDTAVEYLERKR